jgi:hypothetical protein
VAGAELQERRSPVALLSKCYKVLHQQLVTLEQAGMHRQAGRPPKASRQAPKGKQARLQRQAGLQGRQLPGSCLIPSRATSAQKASVVQVCGAEKSGALTQTAAYVSHLFLMGAWHVGSS